MLRKVVVVERKELVMVTAMATAMEREIMTRKEVVMVVQRVVRLIEGGATPALHPREWLLQLASSAGRRI
jgi:hypothetical protein